MTMSDLSGAQFYHYRQGRSPGYNAVVAAVADSHVLGHLSWGPNDTRVQTVWVQRGYRRHGMATALWQHARTVEPELAHHTDRSDAGDAWVRSLHDAAPERTHNTVEENVERPGEFAQRAHEERLKAGRFTLLPGAVGAQVACPLPRAFGPLAPTGRSRQVTPPCPPGNPVNIYVVLNVRRRSRRSGARSQGGVPPTSWTASTATQVRKRVLGGGPRPCPASPATRGHAGCTRKTSSPRSRGEANSVESKWRNNERH